ncbi:protein DpdG [Actinokineospora spheciospongiae]|uniref:protein DpdG n=1 Tax=Actinokineospora spheciospongiae TaxID=909613 RepID=UPI0005556842|nr:protein DpdG [Actinokineospora spheciospongiae]
MDYLTTYARGAAPSLLVISRYLAAAGSSGQTSEQLQRALQPRPMIKEVAPRASLLGPALRIGEHLGLFEQDKAGGEQSWRLRTTAAGKSRTSNAREDDRAFYARVFGALNARALADVEANDLSDLALGIIWFCQRDPLVPLNTAWDGETETVVKSAGIRSNAIFNAAQWLAFRRWAVHLGVATLTERNSKNSYISADCTRAIEPILSSMPVRARADTWISHLLATLPVLGHPRLLRVLPVPPTEPDVISGSLAFALLKLERRGKVQLVPAADASNTMVLRVANTITRIGEIRVLEASTA